MSLANKTEEGLIKIKCTGTEELPLDKIKEFQGVLKKRTKAQKEKLLESLKTYGFSFPFFIWKNEGINWCLDGHGRLEVLNSLLNKDQLPTFPVVYVQAEDEAEAKKKLLQLNSQYGEIDTEGLQEFIDGIDIDMSEFEIPDINLDGLIEPKEEGAIPEVEEGEPICKLGDIWQLGNHRLMCGDSTSEEDVKKLMNGEKAKCLFTSPPYNMGANLYNSYTDNLESKKYIDFNMKVVNVWIEHLKGYLFWNISYNKNSRWEFIEIIYKIVKDTGLRFLELIVWDKGHGIPITSKEMLTRQYEDILLVGNPEEVSHDMELYYLGTTEKRGYFNKKKGKGITNYWRITTGNTQLDNHKACFPVKLPGQAIELTTNENDIVMDCFGGSGTTLIASEQLDRKCYMMELDEKYCDVIIKRWENYTGEKAVKING